MHIEVPRLSFDEMHGSKGECSAAVRGRVARARTVQLQRHDTLNSRLTHQQIDAECTLSGSDRSLLQQAIEQLQLSARAYHRILKLARTIADMREAERISTRDLTEAINYRRLDRRIP
jgi:magnesium chelatase family protein